MKNISKKLITLFMLMLIIVTSVISATAADLTFLGTSSASNSGTATASKGSGYTIPDTEGTTHYIGYRFTLVNSAGGRKRGVDIIKNDRLALYDDANKSTTNYQKNFYVTARKNSKSITMSFSTETPTFAKSEVKKDGTKRFNTPLIYEFGKSSYKSDIKAWSENQENIGPLLKLMGYTGGLDDSDVNMYSDRILIEPMIIFKFSNTRYVMTLTEAWFYAGSRIGYNAASKFACTHSNPACGSCYDSLGYRINGTMPNGLRDDA